MGPASPLRLTGIAAPMAVWALHFVAVYSLQGLACGEGWMRQRLAGMETVSWVLIALTALALAAIARLGWRAWRVRCRETRAPRPDAAGRRRRFAATATALAAALAAIAVSFTALPVPMLPPCA